MSRDPQPDWVLEYRRAVGDRIRDRRIQESRIQWWVCERTGLGRSTYQEIERGETDARLSWLARIAAALNTTVDQLVDVELRPPG
ncbi:helix-turn-helix domain-containing protein [Streptomyces sp. NBC_01477]|uniref:helix-turn-helix domain-containing protein n=1 Tax=Streptomyces sp. NBC_01477 TaxID=2976015 RepID=UPI002E3761C4|nr:helix-turn-helix transcriptional regulator [Streptomyces sp. NBC_01477]